MPGTRGWFPEVVFAVLAATMAAGQPPAGEAARIGPRVALVIGSGADRTHEARALQGGIPPEAGGPIQSAAWHRPRLAGMGMPRIAYERGGPDLARPAPASPESQRSRRAAKIRVLRRLSAASYALGVAGSGAAYLLDRQAREAYREADAEYLLYRRATDGDKAQTDPTGPMAGSYRIIRSGSFGDLAQNTRSAIRYSTSPDYRDGSIGARLLRIP
jgi:hypothetical protein